MNQTTRQPATMVAKASGDKVPFEPEKLRHSLEQAGAGVDAITRILAEIDDVLFPGITTKEIYKRAFSLLRKTSAHLAAKYKLKKAIQELGPSGYPFEKYVAEILKHQGYRVQVGQIVQGHCVQHEVDIIAEKENRHLMIECKFHSDNGRKCDVKVPLYIHSRFLDVEKAWKKQPGHDTKFHQGWLVTNTRFTSDAIKYGTCAGMYLMGWDFPKKGNLKERIELAGLHPLTCLTTLTKREKQHLLNRKIVLCKEICYDEKLLEAAGVPSGRIGKVMKEARQLCQTDL
ncbi:MAG: restriction endonuclease [Saprospiraceae bacterium]